MNNTNVLILILINKCFHKNLHFWGPSVKLWFTITKLILIKQDMRKCYFSLNTVLWLNFFPKLMVIFPPVCPDGGIAQWQGVLGRAGAGGNSTEPLMLLSCVSCFLCGPCRSLPLGDACNLVSLHYKNGNKI